MAECMYVCIEAAHRRGIGGPIAAKDLHQILNVLIVLKSSFFNARTASVASTGAWPGVVLAIVTGAWPGVTRAWPGSFTSTGCGKLDIAAGTFEKLLSRDKGQVGSDIKEFLDELQSCFLCTLMVSICKGLTKRTRHSRSISYKACPGNPPGKCNEGFDGALGPMITCKSHCHHICNTIVSAMPCHTTASSVSRGVQDMARHKFLAQWVAQ